MNPISLIAKFFRFFSVYADPFEKQVDSFLKKIRKNTKKDLEILIQRDLVKLTIFLEYKFKGYKKLKKSYRKKLYKYADLIAKDFILFFDDRESEIAKRQKTLDLPHALESDERMTYLLGIMVYLEPGKKLRYQEASTFEKLLRDPNSETLIGDCNQISTLYIYLYSLRFPVGDLRVKILPKHVCLHYKGVDIETTNATLTDYGEYIFLSGAEEIVAANLLDIADPTEKQFEISPAGMLKSAELAFYFSGHRATVEKNLLIAYHNMAVYFAKQKNFSKAILFANKSGHTRLQKDVIRMEAVFYLKSKKYGKALERFKKIDDKNGQRVCYRNELADLLDKIKMCKTMEDYKRYKTVLRRVRELGNKIDHQEAVNFSNSILKKLS